MKDENGKMMNNIVTGVGIASLVLLACVLGASLTVLYAMALSMNGDYEDIAVRIMSDEYERFKGTPAANPLSLALIELLLYQKKHPEAKQKIQDLLGDIDRKGGMANVPREKVYLLKAIAESETDPTKATLSWEQYQKELNSSPFSLKR